MLIPEWDGGKIISQIDSNRGATADRTDGSCAVRSFGILVFHYASTPDNEVEDVALVVCIVPLVISSTLLAKSILEDDVSFKAGIALLTLVEVVFLIEQLHIRLSVWKGCFILLAKVCW